MPVGISEGELKAGLQGVWRFSCKTGGELMTLRWIFSAALVVVFCLVAQIPLVHADTINHCIDSCFSTWPGSDHEELRQECLDQCRNAPKHGAIAYAEQNGAYGFSYNVNSASAANQRALSNCTKHGDGCKVVISFSETCAALAAGDNDRFAASRGDGRGEAQGNALTACSRDGGKHCEIKAWACARD